MKSDCDSEYLLDEVLADAAPGSYRAELLNRTLKTVRRHRRFRTVGKGTVATLLVVLAVTWLWDGWTRITDPSGRTDVWNLAANRGEQKPHSYRLVESHPLDPAMFVTTGPGLTRVVASTSSELTVVETRQARHLYTEIDDEKLLALLAGRSAALIREGPDQAQLLLPDQETDRGRW
jgi:hypothetical protein